MSAIAAYAEVQSSGLDARVAEHQSLVRRIAYHLLARLPASVDVDDLIQAGQVGLIEAARNWHAGGGASFATFASARVRGAMIDELRRGDWVPRSVHRRAREIAAAVSEVEARTGRDATEAEVAQALGMSLSDYHAACQDAARGPMLSLDGLGEDGAREVAGEDSPEREIADQALRRALIEAIAGLPERERLVMSLYYDEQLNLREIGGVLDVTESRVCQIHAQAVARLRARLADWSAR